MKTILFALAFGLPALAFGQEEGEYYLSRGFGGVSITFSENNRFEYSYGHCTGISEGKGVYSIKKVF